MTNQTTTDPKSSAGAWGIVVLGFMTLALAFTVRGSLSLAMPVWQSEFGWSRGFISGIAAVALLVMAVVAPFAGGFRREAAGVRQPLRRARAGGCCRRLAPIFLGSRVTDESSGPPPPSVQEQG